MTAQLGCGSYLASNGSEPAPEDSLHGGACRLCFYGCGAGDGGVYGARDEFVTAGAGCIPRSDEAKIEKLPDPSNRKQIMTPSSPPGGDKQAVQ